jgi:TonB-dependent SusC/RagA subfamily outer membrane receptor
MKKLTMPGLHPGFMKLIFLCCLFSVFTRAHAQTVSGNVKSENQKNLTDVSITVKGTRVGTFTDGLGSYKITAAPEDTLVFSYIGHTPVEERVGDRKVINVALYNTSYSMDEVVVSALGITKQKRGLGYSTSNIKPDDLTIARTTNVINAVQGKVAGVVINTLGTGPGSTSKIRIRGQSSLSGNNSPLIVVNGVPIDNTNFNDQTVSVPGGGINADGGDGLSSINADDVESMTILKGAAASALYGSRAKDGVIMIQTKTKGKGRGLGVSYNFNYGNETPLDYTDYQNQYGQGENGVRPTTPNPTSGQWSFGEKFAPGMTQTLYNTPDIPYVPQGSRISEFYRHGQNMTNTVTLETSSEKGGMHLSLTNIQNIGIVPNNKFVRNGINLGFGYSLSEHLSFSGSINYTREKNTNPPNIAQQDNSIPTSLMALANSMPLSVLEANKYNAAGNEYPYSRFANRTNPYFTLADQFNNIDRNRVYGNVAVKYKFNSWLSLQGRIGTDYWSRDQD